MRHSILVPIVLMTVFLLCGFSCQKPAIKQSTEEFAREFVDLLKRKEADQLEKLLLTKSEMKQVFQANAGSVSFSQVWKRYQEESKNFFHSNLFNQQWDKLNMASVTDDMGKKKHGMDPRGLLNQDKCEVATIQITMASTDNQLKLLELRDCIKLPHTTWKLSYPPQLKNAY